MSTDPVEDSGQAVARQLASAFALAQGMLLSEEDAASGVEWLALVARDLVPASVGAGASVIDESGHRVSTGTTDSVAATADALQYRLGEGPCLSAWATVAVQHIRDTSTEVRWSAWCAAVQELGIRSVLSAPMAFRGRVIGALKVYSTRVDSFSTPDEHRLVLLAGAAGTLLGAAQGHDAPQQMSAGLKAALADRQAVEVATGMLMERHGTSHSRARSRLMEMSSRRRLPLAELARAILTRSTELGT